MKNPNSTSGVAEETIRVITQLACVNSHAKTLYEKITSEIENGLTEEFAEKMEEANFLLKQIQTTDNLRRDYMRKLKEMFPKCNQNYWCSLKHALQADFNAYECYCGSDDDDDLLELYSLVHKNTVEIITAFLGEEVTSCSSCLSDMLK